MTAELVVERIYPHPPAAVWEALTTPESLRRWLRAEAFAARVGHRFTVRIPRGPGFDGNVTAEVIDLEPGQVLRLWWSGGPVDGHVTFTLEPAGEGTRVRMVQTGFDNPRQHALGPALLGFWQRAMDEQLPAQLGAGLAVGAAGGGIGGAVIATTLAAVAGLVALVLFLVLGWQLVGPSPRASGASAPDSVLVDSARATEPRAARPADEAPVEATARPPRTADADAASTDPEGVIRYYDVLPSTLNPLYARIPADDRAHAAIYDRLFYRDPITNDRRSRLVSSHQVLGRGRQLTLTLVPGLTWHDGHPIEAADLCFTVKAWLHPNNPIPRRTPRLRLADCHVDDTLVATITFTRPVWNPLDHVSFTILPEHAFDSPVVAESDPFADEPIGSGPMRAVRTKRMVRFAAVPSRQHQPHLAGMVLHEMGDPFVAIRTLERGGVDGIVEVPAPLRPEVDASSDMALKSFDTARLWFVHIDPDRVPLRLVRQAIDATLDREELRELTIGVDPNDPNPPCEFISGPFEPSSPFYNRGVPTQPRYDLAKAARLMEAAGAIRLGGRWTMNGDPITLRVAMPAPLQADARDLARQVRNQLQRGGFDVEHYSLAAPDWTGSLPAGATAPGIDLLITAWTATPDQDIAPIFHSRTDGEGELNVFDVQAPAIDALLDELDAAPTKASALESAHALHRALHDDARTLFLWKLSTRSAWSNRVHNNIIAPVDYFSHLDGWRVQ